MTTKLYFYACNTNCKEKFHYSQAIVFMVETFHGGCCSNGCLQGYYTAKDKFVQMAVEGIWRQKYFNYIGRLQGLWPSKTIDREEGTDTMLCTQNLLSFPFSRVDLLLPITFAAT
jgi:hypothetical protein